MNTKNNEFDWRIILVIVVIVAILLLLSTVPELYLIYTSENLDFKCEFKVIDAIIGIASIFIACSANKIRKIQLEIQEGQAIVQLNQAFNDINKLVLSSEANSYIRTFAEILYNCSQNGISESLCDKERKEITPLIFIILNAYEAYYINNKAAFKSELPLILKNLFTHYPFAEDEILSKHSYNEDFRKACERTSEQGDKEGKIKKLIAYLKSFI